MMQKCLYPFCDFQTDSLLSLWKRITSLVNSNLLSHFYLFWKYLRLKLYYLFKHLVTRQRRKCKWKCSYQFSSLPVSCLISWYNNNQVIKQKNFDKRLFSSTGLFMDWKLQTVIIFQKKCVIKRFLSITCFWKHHQGSMFKYIIVRLCLKIRTPAM